MTLVGPILILSALSVACQQRGLPEAFSTNLDRKDLVPLPRELASLIQTGFGEAEVKGFEKLVDSTKVKGTASRQESHIHLLYSSVHPKVTAHGG